MDLNREDLAWAAGLFDGEGSTFVHKRSLLRLGIQQNDPGVLNRFRTAVGGLGNVTGPYRRNDGRSKPAWKYQVGTWRGAQAVLCLLWPWLSDIKRAQALRAGRAIKTRRATMTSGKRVGPCSRNHPLSRMTRTSRGHRRCLACESENYHRRKGVMSADIAHP